jgi:hypothetical protein
VGEFESSQLFVPSLLIFRESAYERKEAWFMVFIVESYLVPSPKRSLHRKIKEVTQRVSLETHASDNLSVCGARLVFQKEVIFKRRKNRRNP